MDSSRLPRFTRASAVASLQITHRDRAIIHLIHQHRFLRSSHIVSLVSGSRQQILRRLKLLYHHGYLERPRAQIDYYHQGGSRHIVYGLGKKAASLLKPDLGPAFSEVSWGDNNRSLTRVFLEHALLVSDVMVVIELACRKAGIRLLTERDLIPETNRPLRWKVALSGRLKLGVVPDRVFALEQPGADDASNRAIFFLEADRGTMPATRRKLSQTSFHRKLLAYAATWSQNLHRSRFGFHRFRVLTVTTSAERLASLLGACETLKHGRGLFLFIDWPTLANPTDPFSRIWKAAGQGRQESLLNQPLPNSLSPTANLHVS